MRIVFFGTGEFGFPALKKLLGSGHELAAAVTQPDRKRGRGWNVQPGPVKAFLEKAAPGVGIYQPEKAYDEDLIGSLAEVEADVFMVIDYGRILGKEVLDMPRKYCVNLHPSLLPKYRGAAPVNWAVINGEKETGNTVFRMTERMDAGEIMAQDRTEIGDEEDAAALLERLSRIGADLVLKVLSMIEKGEETLTGQNEEEATYAPKLEKKHGEIDWSAPAREIMNKVRGLQPWPGAFTYLGGRMLKIIKAVPVSGREAPPGTVNVPGGFIVSAGEGALRVELLQLEGKKAMTPDEFLRGHRLEEGMVLGRSS